MRGCLVKLSASFTRILQPTQLEQAAVLRLLRLQPRGAHTLKSTSPPMLPATPCTLCIASRQPCCCLQRLQPPGAADEHVCMPNPAQQTKLRSVQLEEAAASLLPRLLTALGSSLRPANSP